LKSSVELRTLTITLASVGNRISTVSHCAPSFSTQPLNHTSTARESVREHDLLCFLRSILPCPRLAQHAMVLEVQEPRSNKNKPSPPITHGHCATSKNNFLRTPKCQRRLSPIPMLFATMNLKLPFDEQSGERVFLPISCTTATWISCISNGTLQQHWPCSLFPSFSRSFIEWFPFLERLALGTATALSRRRTWLTF
jgi:hypothetical protein